MDDLISFIEVTLQFFFGAFVGIIASERPFPVVYVVALYGIFVTVSCITLIVRGSHEGRKK